MEQKRLPCPHRQRQLPAQFSWIDQRLVRDGHFQRCDVVALALYLFLLTVADVQGVSFYSDRRLCAALHVTRARLCLARTTLVQAALIAYEAPFYQVLALDRPPPTSRAAPPLQALRQALSGDKAHAQEASS